MYSSSERGGATDYHIILSYNGEHLVVGGPNIAFLYKQYAHWKTKQQKSVLFFSPSLFFLPSSTQSYEYSMAITFFLSFVFVFANVCTQNDIWPENECSSYDRRHAFVPHTATAPPPHLSLSLSCRTRRSYHKRSSTVYRMQGKEYITAQGTSTSTTARSSHLGKY